MPSKSNADIIHETLKSWYGDTGPSGESLSISDYLNLYWEEYNAGQKRFDGRLKSWYEDFGATGISLSDIERDYWEGFGKIVGATAVWSAKNYDSVNGRLTDKTGNDHHAVFPGGVNNPEVLENEGEQYVYLPGVVGNYGSILDVNLLDANTAHVEQSVGLWIQLGSATNVRLESTPTPQFGNSVLAFDIGAGVSYVYMNPADTSKLAPVVAGTTYAWSAKIRATKAMNVILRVSWYSVLDVVIGNTDVSVLLEANTWTTMNNSAAAPTGAVRARIQVGTIDTTHSGEIFYLDAICFRAGSNPTFLPSTRVVGDIDLRVKVALDSYDKQFQGFIFKDNVSTDRSYGFGITNSARVIRFSWSENGSILLSESSTVIPLIIENGTVVDLRCTLDINDGAGNRIVQFMYSLDDGETWIIWDTNITAAPTSIYSGSDIIRFGDLGNVWPLQGKIYSAEVRDGIDGPAVASFNPALASEPFANFTSDEGHTVTLTRSSSGRKLAVVDRTMLLFGTDDYLEVADHPDLDFGAADDFTVVVLVRGYGSNTYAILTKKTNLALGPGWYFRVLTGFTPTIIVDDGTFQRPDSGPVASSGVLSAFAGIRTSTEVDAYLNGVSNGAVADTTTGTLSNTTPVRIGSSGGGAEFADMEFVAAAIFREALSDDDLLTVGKILEKI